MPSCNNDKNETTRFLGDGVSFKAKLIGILEVSEARGDRMCQEALSDLKMAIRAAGEHKQRITIHIALDGLRLRDEKTGDSLYHHPVHKISFIAQDMTDSRAFGYIFGSPDTGHRFFGIKTDKAASQVVIAMRDLFQVVFALKKKEIELAKIHLEKTRYATSPIFSESSTLNAKSMQQDKSVLDHNKAGASSAETKSSGTAVADLVDLELELNSLQQGLNQMERITPSDPFGSKDDPFGDSFISYPKPILPPPPSSGRDRSNRVSESSSIFSPKTPHITATSVDTNSDSLLDGKKDFSFSHDFNSSHEEPSSGDWFTPSAGNSLFEEPPSLVPTEPTKDEKHELAKQEILSQFHVFTELDPLELKNPPKKVLNDLVGNQIAQTQDQANMFSTKFATSPKPSSFSTSGNNVSVFSSDPFGEDPFVTEDPFAEADFTRQDPFETEFNHSNATLNTFRKSRISPRTVLPSATFNKPPQFEYQFEENRKYKMNQLHENPSLDMSSESECAPEPPPRPASTLMQQIKPPPLPPKKQNDIAIKPPPRPPHTEDSHYDYIDNYETAPNSLEFNRLNASELSPPLPVPARKSKFESDFSAAPQRPLKKHYNLQSSEDDYLTPIGGGILLPPPQKSSKKQALERKSSELDGLDITLSQLTLSGLNELANKLKIPASQLSNMTLVQLTNYLSNFIKGTSTPNNTQESSLSNNMNSEAGGFQADFAANFNKLNANEAFDRYAVFRELMQEEIKQTKIDTEPEELLEETQQSEVNSNVSLDLKPLDVAAQDKYAALREIVEKELKQNEHLEKSNSNDTENDDEEDEVEIEEEEIAKTLNKENELNAENQNTQIEYNNTPVDVNIKDGKLPSPVRSPIKTILKSPVPSAVSEIIQNNTRLTSGSLSDVVSGSSPEVDNTASSDAIKKVPSDAAAESWAIFEQTNNISAKQEKQTVQSEEGVSPWSSDSKEFGNGSPPEYRRKDSGSGGDQWTKRRRDQEGWWDTSAEPEVQYYPPNRRSTDSYEEEYYECYDRPRRRRQGGNWSGKTAGGHSSSSRDVSPWEEEPRRIREPREVTRPGWSRHSGRQQSFDRHKERRNTDSWDEEEDDYEYDDEQGGRFHWTDRLAERDRHSTGSREHESDRWSEDRTDERRHKRRSAGSRDRWCCPDWEQTEHEKCLRYGSGRWIPPDRRDRKDPRYYSRESQESPWEDEYSNGPEDSPYYVAKRNWKQRPSSASEMDRKTGEIKSRHYLGTGGSDGERDRRYKAGRRSRSRDSQYSEPSHRIKSQEIAPGARNTHRTNKSHLHAKPIDAEFPEGPPKKVETVKLEGSTKKPSNLSSRKKAAKEAVALKSDESPNTTNTFPRKSRNKFENDFVSPVAEVPSKFKFENDFETEQALAKPLKVKHQLSMLEKSHNLPAEHDYKLRGSFKESKMSPRYHTAKSKSMFEDNFSPCDKPIEPVEENSISSIKEEIDPEEEDSFSISNFEMTTNSRKTILSKNRYARTDLNLKKSDSVNIFARENDPFDDDFFCGNVLGNGDKVSPRSTELRWTEDFEDFDIQGKK